MFKKELAQNRQNEERQGRLNVGIWIVPTTGCACFKCTIYIALDIVLSIGQSKRNVILVYFFSSVSVT